MAKRRDYRKELAEIQTSLISGFRESRDMPIGTPDWQRYEPVLTAAARAIGVMDHLLGTKSVLYPDLERVPLTTSEVAR